MNSGNMNYNVCFITDNEYLVPTIVAMKTLDRFAGNNNYHAHIVTMGLDNEKKKLIEKQLFNSIEISVIDATKIINNLDFDHLYVSKAALLKFFLPEILYDCDTVLYLDDDIILKGDISELFRVDINGYYALVVKDMYCTLSGFGNRLGNDNYFNSGVMYLNLSKMRKDNVSEKLMEYKKSELYHDFMDQDAFNMVLGNSVIFVERKYNYISEFNDKYSQEELILFYGEGALDKPVIEHFAGQSKPWNTLDGFSENEWLLYLDKRKEFLWVVENIIKKIENRINENEDRINKLNDKIDLLNNKIDDLLKQTRIDGENTKNQIDMFDEKISMIEDGIHKLNQQMEMNNQRIDSLEKGFLFRLKSRFTKQNKRG